LNVSQQSCGVSSLRFQRHPSEQSLMSSRSSIATNCSTPAGHDAQLGDGSNSSFPLTPSSIETSENVRKEGLLLNDVDDMIIPDEMQEFLNSNRSKTNNNDQQSSTVSNSSTETQTNTNSCMLDTKPDIVTKCMDTVEKESHQETRSSCMYSNHNEMNNTVLPAMPPLQAATNESCQCLCE